MKNNYFKLSLTLLLIITASIVSAQSITLSADKSEGIIFNNKSFKELKALAQEKNKLIFVDAFTTWCGPCKRMAAEIFPRTDVSEFYNKNFICAKIDMEKGEGLEVAKMYAVRNYPTYLFINGSGELVHRSLGSKSAEDFINDGKNALDPGKQLIGIFNKAKANPKDVKAIYNLFAMQADLMMSADSAILKTFVAQVKDADMTNKFTYQVINQFGSGLDSKEFKLQKNNYPKLVAAFTKDTIDAAYINYIQRNLEIYAKRGKENEYLNFKTKIQQIRDVNIADKDYWLMDIDYYKHTKNDDALLKTYTEGIEKFSWDDATTLNNVAWAIFEKTSDKDLLQKADKYSARSVQLKEEGFNLDTRANIQFKLGNKAEAKKTAEKSIELTKKAGDDASDTEDLLTKINAAQ